MKKAQWITAGIAFLVLIGLYAATQNKLFGPTPLKKGAVATATHAEFPTDSVLFYAKKNLSPEQVTRLNFLEHSVSRGDVRDQQLHIYHQLARFWADTAHIFEPYAWYTAQAARLENSEKSLTFAAHLFLNNLKEQGSPQIRQWEAAQAKELFERSLSLNPGNDSSKVGLGAVILFGGGMPMEGIGKIREVVAKDSTNVYAQMTLAEASLMSGQLDKALERFSKVVELQPDNLEAIFRAAETAEQMGKNKEAVDWYKRLLPHISNSAMKKEVEARIAKLDK
jgi:tetratricopeptide (TPR) repeat protein